MRTIFILIILSISGFEIFAQAGVIKYDVDTVIFNKKVGDSYISDSISARILCSKMPFSYEKAIEGFRHESNKNIVILDKSEFKNGNKRISYKKGKLLEGAIELIIECYLIEWDDKISIFMSGIYASKYETLLGAKIAIAAKSVRLE